MPTLPYTFRVQETGFWCGPAAVQVALSCNRKVVSQLQLAAALGTTVNGTGSSADVVRVMSAFLGAGSYAARFIAGPKVSDEQVATLRSDLVAGIDAGYALVANVRGTILNLNGASYAYNGGHYVAVVGYRAGGDEALVADVAVRNGEYWVGTRALAVWIASRGYARPTAAVHPVQGPFLPSFAGVEMKLYKLESSEQGVTIGPLRMRFDTPDIRAAFLRIWDPKGELGLAAGEVGVSPSDEEALGVEVLRLVDSGPGGGPAVLVPHDHEQGGPTGPARPK